MARFRLGRKRIAVWVVLAGIVAGQARAQDTDGKGDGPPTLHVYTNLMQIPVLVVSPMTPFHDPIETTLLLPFYDSVPPVAATRFSVSLDSEPPFPPTHVRREGEDPIKLAIVLDTSDLLTSLLSGMEGAVVGLAKGALHPQDRVSVYTLNCALTSHALNIPPNAGQLEQAMDEAMGAIGHGTGSKNQKVRTGCGQVKPLLDALRDVTSDLNKVSGRRVIGVVTDGRDLSSKLTSEYVRFAAQDAAVTIFELTERPEMPVALGALRPPNSIPLNSVCQSTGGLKLYTNRANLTRDLERITTMLRERYIVEFPRPRGLTANRHDLKVTIAHSDALILPSGISVPLASDEELAPPVIAPAKSAQGGAAGIPKGEGDPH
jgi:hypothetical protein